MAQKLAPYVGFLLLILLFIFYFVTLFGKEWMKHEDDYAGLWEICETGMNGVFECTWMEHTPSYTIPFLDWYAAVRSFNVLACIFVVIEMIFLILHMCDPAHFKLKPIKIGLVFSNMFWILAIVVFVVELKNIYEGMWSPGWTYYLTGLNLGLTFITTLYFFLIREEIIKDENKTSQNHNSIQMQPVVTNGDFAKHQPERIEIPKSFMASQSQNEKVVIPSSFRKDIQVNENVDFSDNRTLSKSESYSKSEGSYYSDEDEEDETTEAESAAFV